MKRIATLASILLLIAPMALFAGNRRGGTQSGPKGIHTPGTGQPSGTPQGTPGGQRLRDGSGAGQQKRQGNRKGQGTGQQNGTCQAPATPPK